MNKPEKNMLIVGKVVGESEKNSLGNWITEVEAWNEARLNPPPAPDTRWRLILFISGCLAGYLCHYLGSLAGMTQ